MNRQEPVAKIVLQVPPVPGALPMPVAKVHHAVLARGIALSEKPADTGLQRLVIAWELVPCGHGKPLQGARFLDPLRRHRCHRTLADERLRGFRIRPAQP